MMQLPGLGLVGEDSDAMISQIGNEACASASELMGSYDTVDRFMGIHAKSILSLIKAGTEVNDDFVNSLMGDISTSMLHTVSHSKSNNEEGMHVTDVVDNSVDYKTNGGTATEGMIT